jgi:hypothetical protein
VNKSVGADTRDCPEDQTLDRGSVAAGEETGPGVEPGVGAGLDTWVVVQYQYPPPAHIRATKNITTIMINAPAI